jgi:8-oxo-dGTP pyrophosphatase MutT (NUDIX family)
LRHAATALVLREHQDQIQILMTRRHDALAFMGGMWVFPGGTLTRSDQSEHAQQSIVDSTTCSHALFDIAGKPLARNVCLALAIAACRETFEETGVLLAHRRDGAPCASEQLARLQLQRKAFAADAELFVAALEQEELRLDTSALVYWAHWVTPNGPPRRFDTRFFLAAAPESHEYVADTYETTECMWMAPEQLLAAAECGDMKIAQPTRYNLEDLRVAIGKHGTLESLLRNEASRRVGAILPKLTKQEGKTIIVMPWDATYQDAPGESVAPGQHYEPAWLALASKIERDH